MSRGGRGGSRGGGRAKAGTARIGGVDIAYDEGLEADMKKRPEPQPLFPPYRPDKPLPPSSRQSAAVNKIIFLKTRQRGGPLFTSLTDPRAARNPFEGMETYSQQYFAPTRTLPNLRCHWKNTKKRRNRKGAEQFLPKELWKVLGIEEGAARVNGKENGNKGEGDVVTGKETTENDAVVLKKGKGKAKVEGAELDGLPDEEEDEQKPKAPEEEDEEVQEEVDDMYETDEEDMGGDYNAEQYFDDGGDEADDGDEGGGDYFD